MHIQRLFDIPHVDSYILTFISYSLFRFTFSNIIHLMDIHFTYSYKPDVDIHVTFLWHTFWRFTSHHIFSYTLSWFMWRYWIFHILNVYIPITKVIHYFNIFENILLKKFLCKQNCYIFQMFEDNIRKNRTVMINWIKYAQWEDSQQEVQR